jgi:antitoxin FitA
LTWIARGFNMAPRRFQNGAIMGVNFSIKNVPEELAANLRAEAARNHRSVQGELMAMLEDHLRRPRGLTIQQVAERVRSLGIRTEGNSAELVRESRDMDAR